MVDWDKVEWTDLGEVILAYEPFLTYATREEVENRVANRGEQVGFWKDLLDRWEADGILN